MHSIFYQKKTFIYLIISIISIAAALIVGVDDNPPGIILCFFSGLLFVLAFTYNWKKAKHYLLLAAISFVGFFISVILHNVLEVIGKDTFIEIIGAFFFLSAVFLCPAGLVIGIVGSIVLAYKKGEK